MKMENVEVYCFDGYVVLSQEDINGVFKSVELMPEQCRLVADWMLQAADFQEFGASCDEFPTFNKK